MWSWITRIFRRIIEAIKSLFRRPGQALPGRELQVTVDPNTGSSGTRAEIEITGLRPHETATVNIPPSSTTVTADADGNVSYHETFNYPPGDVTITVTAGSGSDAQAATATFTVTN